MAPQSQRYRLLRMSVLAVVVSAGIAACDSTSSSKSNTGGNGSGNGKTTLDELSTQSQDSKPVSDGLDQVEADLLSRFGSADAAPFAVGDTDTVQSLLGSR